MGLRRSRWTVDVIHLGEHIATTGDGRRDHGRGARPTGPLPPFQAKTQKASTHLAHKIRMSFRFEKLSMVFLPTRHSRALRERERGKGGVKAPSRATGPKAVLGKHTVKSKGARYKYPALPR